MVNKRAGGDSESRKGFVHLRVLRGADFREKAVFAYDHGEHEGHEAALSVQKWKTSEKSSTSTWTHIMLLWHRETSLS